MQAISYLILIAALVFLALLLIRERANLRRVRSEREAIVGEERRMFDFLHGLGEALSHDDPEEKMYRLIVEGAATVADATGGAIYTHDSERGVLVPAHFSAHCPPVVQLPERIVERSRGNLKTLHSFLRLHSIPDDFGILGSVFTSQKPVNVANIRQAETFNAPPNQFQQHVSTMIAPLTSNGVTYGILVIADDRIDHVFSPNDYEVFLSVAEQSGYAIGSARIHQEAVEKRRLEGDLKNASEIQRVLLPKSDPELSDYVFSAVNLPAKVVSGDYYDYVRIDENHYGVTIGDVSGKGIPASLVAAMTRSVLRANAAETISPAEVLKRVNRVIFPDIREDMFITKVYLVLDRQSNAITLARAGHNPPLHYRKATGEVAEIEPRGMPIGVDAGSVFERLIAETTIEMEPGDCLLLYTDGATEAIDGKGLEFDVPRLINSFGKLAPEGPDQVIKVLKAELMDFMTGVPQTDDITLIAIEKS